jgi:prevent-host-death family protein
MPVDGTNRFDIQDAAANLLRLIERVERGEEIVISRAGTPIAKIVPHTAPSNRRRRGSLRDQLIMEPDWDSAEVNEAIARDFR